MTRGDLHYPFLAAFVAIAALVLLVQGASAQTQCSATQPCSVKTNCCGQYDYCGTGSAYCGTGCKNGPCTTAASGGSGWSSFLTKALFEQFFPNHLAIYSYENFKAAGQSPYSAFGTSGTLDDQKREVAAFLANVQQESGGLQYVEEINKSDPHCDKTNTQYPCAAGKKYYGRGALQISWNYNYGACGKALNLNLLANPDQVAQNGVIAFKTALWFWMTQSPHAAILKNSFSGTIRAINGDLECNKPAGSATNPVQQPNVEPGQVLQELLQRAWCQPRHRPQMLITPTPI